ncbi:MAG: hypothetical protein FD166_2045 [Bacteroidetes bacterium]|nr:MAG: hypothetical protein FD166_2045 [Bacteroidota bacterium]
MKRISMILSVLALVFAFTIASVSAQNAPKSKTSSEKVVSEKSDKAACTTDKKDGKSCAKTCSDDKAKAGCASTCTGDKAKSCCSKGHTEGAKPVPASDKK